MDIRKISIGPDYKGGAMHYIVGQPVLDNTYKIQVIKFEEATGNYNIYIVNERDETFLWKRFNNQMPISIEFNINF